MPMHMVGAVLGGFFTRVADTANESRSNTAGQMMRLVWELIGVGHEGAVVRQVFRKVRCQFSERLDEVLDECSRSGEEARLLKTAADAAGAVCKRLEEAFAAVVRSLEAASNSYLKAIGPVLGAECLWSGLRVAVALDVWCVEGKGITSASLFFGKCDMKHGGEDDFYDRMPCSMI